jgi:cysteinyl-tRNA synthetase
MCIRDRVGRADLPGSVKSRLLLDFDRVLGLDLGRETAESVLPAGAAELLESRARARAARDFAASDRLRSRLAELGVQVSDGPDGQRWKVVPVQPVSG